ncbi:MAG: HAD-IA family hydrolase [Vulcanococcus sp.]|nr:HAD-IA family hydrolase [Vulcanococcus sp.]
MVLQMVSGPSALLWDVDGTLAETELEGHRLAFNLAFAEAGLRWQWDVALYQQLVRVSGGRERISAFLAEVDGAVPDPERVERLQLAKQRHYNALVEQGALRLRPGVERLIRSAREAGLVQAIVTTSSRQAVQALLDQLLPDHAACFDLWVCGEDLPRKKPDPAAYALALARLGLPAQGAIALEDSGNGVAAATEAGLTTVVTRSGSSATEAPDAFMAAAVVLDHLGDPELPNCVHRGPACPQGQVTLSYLQQLLPA